MAMPEDDKALEGQRRHAELKPRYRWRRTGDMFTPDFVGLDGGTKFGRIWPDEDFAPKERWRWLCTVIMSRTLDSPSKGGADVARQAARDLEDHYDALKRLNAAPSGLPHG
jgi:hypothetical protein